ncbi:MAG: hypothetical protein K2Q18_12300 [Bdellovibrionales bacterium]|nr:hypothetical protein [Bdellovibrionales bacterium]
MIAAYEIRKALKTDRESLIDFIKTDWSENHIFVKDPSFFDYFYANEKDYNFIVGVDLGNNQIVGILGFQSYLTESSKDYFLALWKVRKGISDTALGLKLLNYLKTEYHPDHLHCLGINKKTINIYKFQGYTVGLMDQFFKLNPNVVDFKIAEVKVLPVDTSTSSLRYTFNEVNQDQISEIYIEIQTFSPKKPLSLFLHKYSNHPYYKYNIFQVFEKNLVVGIIVLRKIDIQERASLRVIDYIGDIELFPTMINDLSIELLKFNIEYVDISAAGLDQNKMKEAGFSLLSEENDKNETIVPNYFEPFEKKRVDIYYFTSMKTSYYFFKGDGDQDRPSISKVARNA